ncbi:MAG: hypothetical protein GYB64_07960, partial [Chloroflexi bacterium]|nr:hypothetical protein [Chloroflexota bacterium]
MRFVRLTALTALIVLLLAPTRTAQAATFIVNDTGLLDTGVAPGICDTDAITPGNQCTLPLAIVLANTLPGTDIILFNIPGTDTISMNLAALLTPFPIIGDLEIDGLNQATGNRIIIDADGGQLFYIDNVSVSIENIVLREGGSGLTGLTTAGGLLYNDNGDLTIGNSLLQNTPLSSSLGDTFGGAIYNDGGDLTLNGTVIDDNSAFDGGGIYNAGGTVAIVGGSVIQNNSATSGGAGMFNSGTMLLNNATVTNNQAGLGAGIKNEGTLNLVNASVVGNRGGFVGTFGVGAGIASFGGNVTIESSSIQNNGPVGSNHWLEGGGLFLESATVDIIGSSISENRAGAPAGAVGGGLLNAGGTVSISDSRIQINMPHNASSQLYGGGIANTGSGQIDVLNSTISGNQANGQGSAIYNEDGQINLFAVSIFGSQLSGGGVEGAAVANLSSMDIESSTIGPNNSGAALAVLSFKVTLIKNTTIAFNDGIGLGHGAGDLRVVHTTIANNGDGAVTMGPAASAFFNAVLIGNSGSVPCSGNVGGIINDGSGPNIEGGSASCGPAFVTGTAGLAGGLADNGGPTRTITLTEFSDALDLSLIHI